MAMALVTGASGGIGREMALYLAKHGVASLLVARREAQLNALQADIMRDHQMHCPIMVGDITDPAVQQALLLKLQQEQWQVDYLINNAGIGDFGPFAAAAPERISQLMQLNIIALTQLTQLLLPQMIARGSARILQLGSIAGMQPLPRFAVYAASKAYVIAFSEALAVELAPHNISVTCLCPGVTETDFFTNANMQTVSFVKQGLKRAQSAEVVAQMGIEAMLAGKRLVFTQQSQAWLAALQSMVPRAWVLALANRLMR